MALTQSNFKAIMERIAEKNSLDVNEMFNQIQDIYQLSASWGSKAAKDLAYEKNVDISKITATGKGGKITLKDVKNAAGIKITEKASLFPFVSTKAKELATEHNLVKNTKKNFPMKMRSGINKATGKKTKITLSDVRRVAGVSSSPNIVFASKSAKELAEKYNLSAEDITDRTGKGNKIKVSDIESHMESNEDDDEVNSDIEE